MRKLLPQLHFTLQCTANTLLASMQFVCIINSVPASEGADCGVVQELLLGKRTVLAGAA